MARRESNGLEGLYDTYAATGQVERLQAVPLGGGIPRQGLIYAYEDP